MLHALGDAGKDTLFCVQRRYVLRTVPRSLLFWGVPLLVDSAMMVMVPAYLPELVPQTFSHCRGAG